MVEVTNYDFPCPAWKIAIGSLTTSALAAGSTLYTVITIGEAVEVGCNTIGRAVEVGCNTAGEVVEVSS